MLSSGKPCSSLNLDHQLVGWNLVLHPATVEVCLVFRTLCLFIALPAELSILPPTKTIYSAKHRLQDPLGVDAVSCAAETAAMNSNSAPLSAINFWVLLAEEKKLPLTTYRAQKLALALNRILELHWLSPHPQIRFPCMSPSLWAWDSGFPAIPNTILKSEVQLHCSWMESP